MCLPESSFLGRRVPSALLGKYQNEGGPGARDIVDLLKTNSTKPEEDVNTFLDSIVYNWLIAGTDAHAKNYAPLIGAGSRVRLAPRYDVASVLPYSDINLDRVKVPMKIGGEYRLRDINRYRWRTLAEELRMDAGEIIQRANNCRSSGRSGSLHRRPFSRPTRRASGSLPRNQHRSEQLD